MSTIPMHVHLHRIWQDGIRAFLRRVALDDSPADLKANEREAWEDGWKYAKHAVAPESTTEH